MGAFRAHTRAIRAGRALLAPQQSSFNPWGFNHEIQGWSPVSSFTVKPGISTTAGWLTAATGDYCAELSRP